MKHLLWFVLCCITLVLGVLSGPWLEHQVGRLFPAAKSSASNGVGVTWYQSQMHPWIIQPEPGTCPICGMDLTPIDPSRFSGEIVIEPAMVQNLGVRVQAAQSDIPQFAIQALGILEWDPSLVYDMQLRAEGWIESVAVAAPGDRVAQGQELFQFSSPQLYAAQAEYLAIANSGGDTRAAEVKLSYLGFSDLEALRSKGTASQTISVRAPASGVVTEKMVFPGTRVEPGMITLRVADPRTVWATLRIFESDVPQVQRGQAVQIQLQDGQQVSGTIDYLEPELDRITRTARARVILDNPQHSLRAGLWARGSIHVTADTAQVLVPREAVLGTGERHLVFVSARRGRYQPREVQLGPIDAQGRVVITNGLQAGEQVVVSGQFLIDSESRMKEALAKVMFGQAPDTAVMPINQPATTAARGPERLAPVLAAAAQAFQAAWSEDLSALHSAGNNLSQALAAFASEEPETQALPELAAHLTQASALPTARSDLGKLGALLHQLTQKLGTPPGTWWILHCGMAKVEDGGWWLQTDEDPRNPYFGAKHPMSDCAGSVERLP